MSNKGILPPRKAFIVGAGFSGLTLGYYLEEAGWELEFFEKEKRGGGILQSRKLRHGIAEAAANAFISSEALEDLAAKIGVVLVPVLNSGKKRLIWRHGQARRWPLTILESFWLLCRLLILPFRLPPQDLETLESWGYRALGRSATDKLLSAALQGIYAGDPKRMSAKLIISKAWRNRRKSQKPKPGRLKGSVSPLDGMGSFQSRLVDHLVNKGAKLHLDAELSGLSLKALHSQAQESGAVVFICTPPPQAAELLESVDPKTSALIGKIEMLPVLSVTMIYPKAASKWQAFGCLFPRNEGFRVLGVLMNSEIFPNRSAEHSETWIFNDNFNNETEVLDCIRLERKKMFQEESTPLEFKISRWIRGIPHYSIQLESILSKGIEEKLRNKGIVLHGNYLGDLGLTKILERSKRLAKELN